MKIIDLRSDTVTLPSKAMMEAIYNAPLGDDVFSDDPTVNRLEELAADMFDREAALLVPSGTMANLASLLTHCPRGTECILGDQSHIFIYEAGGIAAVAGVQPHTVKNQDNGEMLLSDIRSAIRDENVHFPRTKLVCLENTHNRCGGVPLSLEYIRSVYDICQRHNLRLHIDGARIFNAAIATGRDVSEIASVTDTLTVCLSKGLSAPVGSLVIGEKDFVDEARRNRKMLGGGMRQAGIIAAAGIVALNDMVDRLKLDHENAQILANAINEMDELTIDPNRVKSNLVFFNLNSDKTSDDLFVEEMSKMGILFFKTGVNRFRMVTHYGIVKDDIFDVINRMKDFFMKI